MKCLLIFPVKFNIIEYCNSNIKFKCSTSFETSSKLKKARNTLISLKSVLLGLNFCVPAEFFIQASLFASLCRIQLLDLMWSRQQQFTIPAVNSRNQLRKTFSLRLFLLASLCVSLNSEDACIPVQTQITIYSPSTYQLGRTIHFICSLPILDYIFPIRGSQYTSIIFSSIFHIISSSFSPDSSQY